MGALVALALHRPEAVPPLLGAAAQLGFTLFLIARPGERRVHLWFAAVSLCAGTWSVASALILAVPASDLALGRHLAELAFVAISFAGPVSLRFATLLARAPARFDRAAVALGLVCAVAIVAFPSLTQVKPRPGGGLWPIACPSFAIAAISALPPMLYGIERVRRAWRALKPCVRRRQLGWAWAALMVGALGGTDARTLFVDSYPLGWLTGSLSCVLLVYSLAQRRLMAFQTFARQSLLGLAGALSVGGVVLALAWICSLGTSREELRLLSAPRLLAAGAFALFLLSRLWVGAIEPALSKVLGRRRRRIERAIAELERRSLGARSTAEVEAQLGDALARGFGARLIGLLVPDPDGAPFDPALARLRSPALRDLVDLDDRASAALVVALDRLGAEAVVPLLRDDLLVAAAAIAPAEPRSLRPADDELASHLGRLGERAARAFVNARLYQEVARRSTGLEAQVRMRTAELEDALFELRAAQARLVEAEHASSLGLLVAGVSHEINNALNFISANLPSLARYVTECERVVAAGPAAGDPRLLAARAALPASLSKIGESVRKTGAILSDLRKFARADTERRLVRVEEGLDAALNLLRRRTDGKLDVARLYSGAPSLEGYPGPLSQCFFNLLLNAVEAASSAIWIVLGERGDRGGVELIVDDDGAGIPPEHLEEVFQPFFTTKTKAAGLGLTVSRGIIERHGGSLTLVSEPGHGTTVRVRLPPRAPDPPARPERTERGSRTDPARGEKESG
ncbi:MAG TPA: HAMP domain-containing sensor histidine kinase [Polyangia bacterium]